MGSVRRVLERKIKFFEMGGPCCCESNVKAAFVLGVFFVVLSLLNCLGQDENGGRLQNIISGLVGAVIAGTLVYGAKTRNRLAILIWIVLAVIECILVCIFVGIYVAIIFFIIWTIVVAKNARQEILEEDGQ